ncbi:MAG: hypothetical protein L3J04_07755 [Robiginitomaculum sp.]|nr:hypothetical protein [Robiginitomaculum sp.]
MATINEQWILAWNEYETLTSAKAINYNDFITWALENDKWKPRPQDIRSLAKKEVGAALRQLMRIDERGVTYRAKQVVKILEDGNQLTFVFDIDTGGTDNLRRKAIRQRRDAVAADIFRARSDVDHMNFKFPTEEPYQFPLDFSEDYEERRAEERMKWQAKQSEERRKLG